uniref:Uncharacterized protein n=1 Tax=Salix viminalis TaxID=40686 RepID=A0A6N2NDS6_SALVM
MNNMFSVQSVKAILALQHLDYSCSPLTMFLLTDLKNLAAEKKILREIKASEKGKIVSLWSSLTEIDNSIYPLHGTPCYPSHDSAGGDKQMLKDMKQLEIAREKAVANASVKGRYGILHGSLKIHFGIVPWERQSTYRILPDKSRILTRI